MSDKVEIVNSCEACVFLSGSSCQWGRLDKFKANGATIDVRNGVPTILGRFCSAKRRQDWLDKIEQKSNVEIVLRAEMLIRTECYVYLEDFHYKSFETTLESLKRQVLKPSLVVAVCNNQQIKPAKIFRLLDECGLPYRLDQMKEAKTRNQAIDIAANKCTSAFYQVLNQGQFLHTDAFANLDEAINERLERIMYIAGNSIQGETVYFLAHKNFFGNEPCRASLLKLDASDDLILNNLQEKLEFVAKLDGNEHYVRKSL